MNYLELFNNIYPDLFKDENIHSIPKNKIFSELIMDLHSDLPNVQFLNIPSGITFGEYKGDIAALHNAVYRVDDDWVQYFNEDERFYCAYEGEKVIAFCILTDMGNHQGIKIGGPGCVGTIPEFRRQGIGLEMVRLATDIFRKEGFDLSWIHRTHLAQWYMKLGYKTVLRWDCSGILNDD